MTYRHDTLVALGLDYGAGDPSPCDHCGASVNTLYLVRNGASQECAGCALLALGLMTLDQAREVGFAIYSGHSRASHRVAASRIEGDSRSGKCAIEVIDPRGQRTTAGWVEVHEYKVAHFEAAKDLAVDLREAVEECHHGRLGMTVRRFLDRFEDDLPRIPLAVPGRVDMTVRRFYRGSVPTLAEVEAVASAELATDEARRGLVAAELGGRA